MATDTCAGKKKIYRVSYQEWDKPNWCDKYDSCIVGANSPEDAARIHPSGGYTWIEEKDGWYLTDTLIESDGEDLLEDTDWGKQYELDVEFIGYMTVPASHPDRVILASFNAA